MYAKTFVRNSLDSPHRQWKASRFPAEVEEVLVSHILKMEELLTINDIRKLAYDILESNSNENNFYCHTKLGLRAYPLDYTLPTRNADHNMSL